MDSDALEVILVDHRAAIDRFLGAARRVDDRTWAEPRARGKWSPAQIVEHVALAEEFAVRMVRGTHGARRAPAWVQPVLRWLGVGLVLRLGAFPPGAQAPATVMPSAPAPPPEVLCSRLRGAADELARVLHAATLAGRRSLEHPFFGGVGFERYVALQTLHVRHHLAQMPSSAGA